MLVVFYSLLAAFFFASHSVVVKVGLENSNPAFATLISSTGGVIFLWTLTVLFVPFGEFAHKGVLYLGVAGLLAPSLARVFLYTGIEKVGVSRSEPINGTAPIFGSIGAILVLGERVTVAIGVATILMVLGIVVLTSSVDTTKNVGGFQWRRRDLVFPLIAAVIYGISRVFRKLGMITIASPLAGASVLASISLLFFILLFPFMGKRQEKTLNDRKSIFFFLLGGILGGMGQICVLAALRSGDVVIVGPLAHTTPLFALILTYVFLRRSENVTLRVTMSAILVVAGVAILTSVT